MKDLDICIQSSEGNAKKMVLVINDFGFGSLGLTREDFVRAGYVTQLGHEPLRIDILNDMDALPFDEAWENRKEVLFNGVRINIIGYGDLLKLKGKAGRPKIWPILTS